MDASATMTAKIEMKLKSIDSLDRDLKNYIKANAQTNKNMERLIDANYDTLDVQINKVNELFSFQGKETANKIRNFTNKLNTMDNSFKESKTHIQTTLSRMF